MAVVERRHSSHWGAFTAEVADGRMVGARPFAHDADPSPLIHSVADAVHDKSRVGRPAIRKGWLDHGPGGHRERRGSEPFVAVPWDEALDIVATELGRVRAAHGNEAIFAGSYGWSSAGRFHHAKTQLQRYLNTIGGYTGSVHTYSFAAGYAILPYVVGTNRLGMVDATTWDSITEHTELFVAFGGLPLKNDQVSSGGAGAHVGAAFMRAARAAGTTFVNISPIRDDAADFLDAEWLAPRPGSDMALMLALAHTLAGEGLADDAFLARYCVGYERFRRYLEGADDGQPKDADWAAPRTEIAAATIRDLARRMAGQRTMINTNWALQRAEFGEQAFWMTVVLAAMLGQIGLPGGGFGFGYGSMGGVGNPREAIATPLLSAGTNPCDTRIPVARIADMLLAPGRSYDFDGARHTYPDIRLVYWCGGNPFHHHQDLNRLIRAWRQPETIIVNEPWWTATARFSDIVLASTTTLERNDIGATARDRFILAMERAIDPVGEARNDFDIFSDLAHRSGTFDAFSEGRDETDWLRHIYDRARQAAAENDVTLPAFDTFWADGHVEVPRPADPYVLLAAFRADPAANPLGTPSGRIEIFSETIAGFRYADCPPHPTWLEPVEWLGSPVAERYPLHLISNQPGTRLHAQMDCGRISRESKIAGREPVWLHPDDAAARGLADGDIARIHNDRGALLAGVHVTAEVRPGVIQLATGAWYDPVEPGTVGSLDKHGNPNVVTRDVGTSSLGQGPSAHSTLVEMTRYEGEPPPVTAFEPPEMIER